MHLKSLTLRGFKSFAGSTTLALEPGLTCVVGPNGSGKSNVVDAIAWVLGEQGAKALRGGKMEDVIFAGSPGRPPLGRAEVQLTIDNSDGALPIEYAEVTIGRLMYRSGESEYTINGSSCRLLDVQELLSDSGIGREMHVIVGQGSLDAVLGARPEDRRGFIEEAAGVLKHRKRKERALRKLDATATSIERLTDLAAELRRQLGPLGRQAEAARRAGTVQASLRDARLRLLADDLVNAGKALEARGEADGALTHRLAEGEERLREAIAADETLTTSVQQSTARAEAAAQTWHALGRLAERLASVGALAQQRATYLGAEEPLPAGRDPEQLEAESAAAAREEQALSARAAQAGEQLESAQAVRVDAERDLNACDERTRAAARAAADRREGLARLTGSLETARGRLAAATAEDSRLEETAAAARRRAAECEEQAKVSSAELERLDASEVELDGVHAAAEAALETARSALAACAERSRVAEQERVSALAARDTWVLSLERDDGTAAILADPPAGVLGATADLIKVSPGAEAAIAAALGSKVDGLVAADPRSAIAALEAAAGASARVAVLVGAAGEPAVPPGQAPIGAWAIDLVDVSPAASPAAAPGLRRSLRRLLTGLVVVDDLQAAARLVADHPELMAVTRGGDLLSAASADGGATAPASSLAVRAAVDAAQARVRAVEASLEAEAAAAVEFEAAVAEHEAVVNDALAQLHDSDAAIAAFQDELARATSAARTATAEAERVDRAREELHTSRTRHQSDADALAAQLASVNGEQAPAEPDPAEREGLAAALEQVRGHEAELRLAAGVAREKVRAITGRAAALMKAAENERAARSAAERRRLERRASAERAVVVAELAAQGAARLAESLEAAGAVRAAADAQRAEADRRLTEVRELARTLTTEVDSLRDARHRDEVARTEQRLMSEGLQERCREEWGMEPDILVAEYGPHLPVPPDAEEGQLAVYNRAAQEKRAAEAERVLARLGTVNPLALEEYAALQERATFLAQQVEDLQKTRRELLGIIRDVDARVIEVMESAFADTAREFSLVFPTLFPGGEGRLVLTDPDDLLLTGIEVEVRPAGKRVSRLSLLSGGERSLAALAFLLAVFRARPSPFYVLDEVEAALDDRNLGRLLEALEQLRASSQLLIVTHQKRTMEIADALYGVTMRRDGVTTVVSQRLRERLSA
ncbi:MAG TPA: chromosome segregation protein SMC [Frankiaceae bacterium]|nr:chromosome segregation protein SMC [Frankiaceae bacterium]